MRLLEAALLGLVQGLTEFLPISSSGHLALLQALLGWKDPDANLTFNVAVHVGSLLAVAVYVWSDIVAMFTRRPRLLLVVAVATVPLAAGGFFLKPLVRDLQRDLLIVGFCFLVTAGLLFLVRRAKGGVVEPHRLSLARAFGVGCAQVIAVLPGVSRSGTTLSASLLAGVERDQAVTFIFLLAAPAILGAGLLQGIEALETRATLPWGEIALGTVVSFFASLIAMRLLVGVVKQNRLGWFSLYCLAAAAVSFAAS